MIKKNLFGVIPNVGDSYSYTIVDEKGQSVILNEYACSILQINVLDKDNNFRDVALGYDLLNDYLKDTRSFGATIGRYANRIANAEFALHGKIYKLAGNNGKNHLHGGVKGFSKKLFKSTIKDDNSVMFQYFSPDMEEGYPGNFTLNVTASFINGSLKFDYQYLSDKDTPANITNHNYFNLNGHGTGNIFGHYFLINADEYCHADSGMLALAPLVSVENTPFDFRIQKRLYDGISSHSKEIINAYGGYDHCFKINHADNNFAASSIGEVSGIKLEVFSDMPALQFYTGNQIGIAQGKNGELYNSFDGFALECQHFPNAMNEPAFKDTGAVIKAGVLNNAFIEYKFSTI